METNAKEILEEGLKIVQSNSENLKALRLAKPSKLNNLLYYMLSGYPVTGDKMMRLFAIYSYRDAIYALRKRRSIKVSQKTIFDDKGVQHEVWWLSMFSEEFVKQMDPSVWN